MIKTIPQTLEISDKNGALHVFLYLSLQLCHFCCILIQSITAIHRSPPLHSFFFAEMSLVLFCTRGEGSVGEEGSWGSEGLGGRLATGRHLSPRLASAHCCQPSSNQQSSMCLAAEGVSNQPLAPS